MMEMMHPDKATILDTLQALDRKDPQRKLFGAADHQYRLHPPLGEEVVRQFEEQHGISPPDDYRHFITSIGNGGAGPYCGLFRFGEHDNGDEDCRWDEGFLIGDVGQPFPHVAAWNLPKTFWDREPDLSPGMTGEEEDRLMELWDAELNEQYWHPRIMNGAIPLCHRGCALRQWLVVNGPQKGYVWDDDRADNAGIAPLFDSAGRQMTFSDWYLDWLESFDVEHVARIELEWKASHCLSERWYLYSMVAGLVPGVVVARWNNWPVVIGALATGVAAIILVAVLDGLCVQRRRRNQA